MHGMDGGAEAIGSGYVDQYREPSQQGVHIVKE